MFSIVIPTYNRAAIISRTLDSVLAQTYQDWECLIVDDFSTDNTRKLIEKYEQKDNRFHYVLNERKKGAQGARNTGIYHATSEWIVFFDSDDIMHNDLLDTMVNAIMTDDIKSDVYTCFSNVINRDSGEIVGKFEWICDRNIQEQLLTGKTYVDFNGAIIKRSRLMEIGGLDEDCPSMQEWETHIRLSKIATYTTVPKILVDYYVGGADTISADKKRETKGYLYLLEKHQQEWMEHYDSYLMYGERVLNILRNYTDKTFEQEYKKTIFHLMPELKLIILKKAVKNKYNIFKRNIVKTIHKLHHG